MSGAQSISARRAYGVQRVCRVWGRARSSVYVRRHATRSRASRRRGPVGAATEGAGRPHPPSARSLTVSWRRVPESVGEAAGRKDPHLTKSYSLNTLIVATVKRVPQRGEHRHADPSSQSQSLVGWRTLVKENLLWVRSFETIEELRLALLEFQRTYNSRPRTRDAPRRPSWQPCSEPGLNSRSTPIFHATNSQERESRHNERRAPTVSPSACSGSCSSRPLPTGPHGTIALSGNL